MDPDETPILPEPATIEISLADIARPQPYTLAEWASLVLSDLQEGPYGKH